MILFFFWQSSNANKVDAVTISGSIGKIVSKVCSCLADTLSILQASDTTLPVHLLVTEAGPAMRSRFFNEIFHASSNGSCEQMGTGYRIVEFDWRLLVFDGLQEGSRFPISGVFCVVTVEVADSIRGLVVAIPSEIFLHWFLAGSVTLLRHCFFSNHDGVFRAWSRAEHLVEKTSLTGVVSGTNSA